MARQIETLANIPMFQAMGRAVVKALDARCTWRRGATRKWVIDY